MAYAGEGKVPGNYINFYYNGTLMACARDADFTSANSPIDATCKDNDGAQDTIPGGNEWSGNCEIIMIMGANNNFDALWDIHENKEKMELTIGSDTAGEKEWFGDCYIDFGGNFPLNDVATAQITINGSGPLSRREIT